RLLEGRSPFKADRRHIHHRLLALGFEHWEAVSLLYLAQAGFLIGAWFMRYEPDMQVGATFAALSLALVLPIHIAERRGWQWRPTQAGAVRIAENADRGMSVRAWASGALAVIVGAYVMSVLAFGAPASRDLQWLAGILGFMLLLGLLVRRHAAVSSWLEKGALYSCAALAIFLGKMTLHETRYPRLLEYLLFPLLAVAVAVWIRCTGNRAF